MDAKLEIRKITTLVMTHEEADWLKKQMQNPIVSDESAPCREMRNKFWDVLNRLSELGLTTKTTKPPIHAPVKPRINGKEI